MRKLALLGLAVSGCLLPSVALRDWDDSGQGGSGAGTSGGDATSGAKTSSSGTVGSGGNPMAGRGGDVSEPDAGGGGMTALAGGNGGDAPLGGDGHAGAGGAGGGTSSGPITEYPLAPGAHPYDIVRGPDNNMWVSQGFGSYVRITADGVQTEFAPPFPRQGSSIALAVGSDGNIWFANPNHNQTGFFSIQGIFQVFSGPTTLSIPQDITYGPDGNWWLAEVGNIHKMTPAGVYTSYPVPSGDARSIVAGADGRLWFTERNTHRVSRITTAGVIEQFDLPTTPAGPMGILRGLDGHIWFTQEAGSRLARITEQGAVTEYDLPEDSGPLGLVEGPRGVFWVVLSAANQIARVTIPVGLELFDIPTENSYSTNIALDADGNVWFTELLGNKIGKLVPPP